MPNTFTTQGMYGTSKLHINLRRKGSLTSLCCLHLYVVFSKFNRCIPHKLDHICLITLFFMQTHTSERLPKIL